MKHLEKLLVWEQANNLPVFWDTAAAEAFRYAGDLLHLIREDEDLKHAVPHSCSISGIKGSGKTTFLNWISNTRRDLRLADFDALSVAIYGHLHNAKFKGSLGSYAASIQFWKKQLKSGLEKEQWWESIPWYFHFSTGGPITGSHVILMSPRYDTWRRVLFTRDHDPKVERTHTPSKLLSPLEFNKEMRKLASKFYNYEPSQYALIPAYHDYQHKDFVSIMSMVENIVGKY